MTRRRGKLKSCEWCGELANPGGERVCCTYDDDGKRYHPSCLAQKVGYRPPKYPMVIDLRTGTTRPALHVVSAEQEGEDGCPF
jgi:hypothetical protein